MATHSIGTGGDFSTPQAWEDDIPATLTEQRIGQLKNQEFTAAATWVLDVGAHTTTSSFNIILETESGASFKNNANVRTNALRYNASNGAGFRKTAQYHAAIYFSGQVGHMIIRNFQVKCEGDFNTFCIYGNGATAATDILIKDMILEHSASSTGTSLIANFSATAIRYVNLVCIKDGTGGNGLDLYGGTAHYVIGCTVVRPSNRSAAGTGIVERYVTTTVEVRNTAVFGFSTASSISGPSTGSSGYNAASNASGLPGSNNQHSVTYSSTTPFVNATSASSAHDFRLADDANSLINNGDLDSTYSAEDISGTTRTDPTEIGAWELAASSATYPSAIINNPVAF
jgi:hypothetical protein